MFSREFLYANCYPGVHPKNKEKGGKDGRLNLVVFRSGGGRFLVPRLPEEKGNIYPATLKTNISLENWWLQDENSL